MRKLLILITIVSGLAACVALYASLAFVTSGNDAAAKYAMLMLLAMLTVTLLFGCAADNAAPYRRAHRRRIGALHIAVIIAFIALITGCSSARHPLKSDQFSPYVATLPSSQG